MQTASFSSWCPSNTMCSAHCFLELSSPHSHKRGQPPLWRTIRTEDKNTTHGQTAGHRHNLFISSSSSSSSRTSSLTLPLFFCCFSFTVSFFVLLLFLCHRTMETQAIMVSTRGIDKWKWKWKWNLMEVSKLRSGRLSKQKKKLPIQCSMDL